MKPRVNGRRIAKPVIATNAAVDTAPPRNSREVSAERVKQDIRSRFNPVRNLTPERLLQQIDSWEAGQLREFAITLAAIEERDDKVKTCALKRKKAIARHGWEILTVDVDESDTTAQTLAAKQKEALEFFYNHLTATSVLEQDQRGGVRLLVMQMAEALSRRYSVHEIVWEKRGPFYTATFWHCPQQFFEATTGRLRFLEQSYGLDGVEMRDSDWLVSVGDGIGLATALCYMIKRLPLRDWLLFTKKFGIPGLHGETTAAPGSKEWTSFVSALQGFYNDWAMVTSEGQKITPVEVKSGGGNLPFPPLVEWADRAIATLWRGADLGTMSQKGDAVGSSVQASETDLLEQDDTLWASETLNTRLDRLVIEYTFGRGVPVLAYIQLKTVQKQNVELDLKIDQASMVAGFPISLQSWSERYKRPLPGIEEDLLAAPKPEEADSEGAKPAKEKKQGAANEKRKTASEGLLEAAVARATGVSRDWLQPAADLLDDMEARAKSGSLSDSEFLDLWEKAALRLPELLGQLGIEELSRELEAGLGTAVLQGLVDAMRKEQK